MAWDTSNRRAELPAGWERIRARILARDRHRCTWIEDGQRCEARATDVDHIEDKHDHADTNLRSLCRPHHNRHTQTQATAARARYPRLRPPTPHPGVV